MNPIELFFGHPPPLIVRLLKDRPDWLLQVVSRAKRFMMAQVHPDRGHSGDLELSSEISGAFSALEDFNRWPEYLEEYLAKPNRTGFLQGHVHSLKKDVERLHKSLRNKEIEIERLKQLLLKMEDIEKRQIAAWHWFVSMAFHRLMPNPDLPENLFPKGSVSRGRIHHFRMIVEKKEEYDGYKYTAYEFDITGRVRLSIRTNNLVLARTVFIFSAEQGPRKGAIIRRQPGPLLVGSMNEKATVSLKEAFAEDLIKPYVSVGAYPVFVVADSYAKLMTHRTQIREWEEQILEMVPIKKTRRELIGPGGRNSYKPSIKTRLREYKRKQK